MTSTKPRLKIAYLCDHSPLEAWTYSGGNSLVFKALQDHVGDVEIVDNSWGFAELVRRALHHLPEHLFLRVRWRVHLLLSRVIAASVHKQLKRSSYDVLFCQYSFQSLAAVKTPDGMVSVFSSDATPSTYKNSEIGQYFGSYLKISRWFDRFVLAREKKVLRAQDLNLWPSLWQKDLADKMYGLSETQSVMVPWGANIAKPEIGENQPAISNNLKLLVLGRDWDAKGGPIAFEVMQELRSRGVNASLSVVGCTPPQEHQNDNVSVYPNLDKTDPEQLQQFEFLLRTSHFLVLPSIESFGFAFCEASAYGLPSLCLNAGGVPVVDGVNGHRFATGSQPSTYADKIIPYITYPDAYSALRATSRKYYETTLNWEAWGRSIAKLIKDKANASSATH